MPLPSGTQTRSARSSQRSWAPSASSRESRWPSQIMYGSLVCSQASSSKKLRCLQERRCRPCIEFGDGAGHRTDQQRPCATDLEFDGLLGLIELDAVNHSVRRQSHRIGEQCLRSNPNFMPPSNRSDGFEEGSNPTYPPRPTMATACIGFRTKRRGPHLGTWGELKHGAQGEGVERSGLCPAGNAAGNCGVCKTQPCGQGISGKYEQHERQV